MSENNLFLLSNLSAGQQSRLDDAGIQYHQEMLMRPPGTLKQKFTNAILGTKSLTFEGLLLDQAGYTEALAVLGAVQMSDELLPDLNIHLPTLRFSEAMRPVVTVAAWRDGGFPRVEPFINIVKQTLLHEIRRDIALHAPGTGEPVAPGPPGQFRLNIWSSPDRKANKRPADQRYVFGIAVPSGSTAFGWSGRGTKIVDGTSSGVGELFNRSNAYCFYDLTSTGTARELIAFRRFCEELAIAFKIGDKKYRRRMRQIRNETFDQRRADYVELAEKTLLSSEQQLAAKLEGAETAARQAQAVYLAALMRVDDARAEYDSLSGDRIVRRRRFEVEFDRFHNDPKFERVEREGDTVHVFTRTLYFATSDKKKVFRLGPLRIDILLDSSEKNSPIKILNLEVMNSGKTSQRHHPHVVASGYPCLGTSSSFFVELVRNREIYGAASYAVQYAETTNTSDSSQWEDDFPRVPPSELDALREAHLLPAGV